LRASSRKKVKGGGELIEEEEFEALADRVADLERDYAELSAKMTPAKIGALVEKYVKEQAQLAGYAKHG
jgi:hypothetical protein